MLRSFVTRHIFLSFWLLAFLIGFAAITLMSVPYDINEVMGALDEAQKELNLNYFSILLSIVVAKKYPSNIPVTKYSRIRTKGLVDQNMGKGFENQDNLQRIC